MSKCKTAEDARDEILNAIDQKMTNKNSDVNVSIWQGRMDICNEYVLLFFANFKNIIVAYKLTKTDILVIMQMLEYMQYGNLLRISYAKLAKDVGIDPKNINKTIKRLRDSDLLIEIDDNTYLNPHVIAKGKFKKKDEKVAKLLERIAEMQNEHITPSILTDKLKKQKRIDETKKRFEEMGNDDWEVNNTVETNKSIEDSKETAENSKEIAEDSKETAENNDPFGEPAWSEILDEEEFELDNVH